MLRNVLPLDSEIHQEDLDGEEQIHLVYHNEDNITYIIGNVNVEAVDITGM